MHYASVKGHAKVVELLLENKASVETGNADGRTALMFVRARESKHDTMHGSAHSFHRIFSVLVGTLATRDTNPVSPYCSSTRAA